MRIATRIVTGLTVLVLAIGAGLPAFIGLGLERFHPQWVENLDQRLDGITLRQTDYQRRWLSSAARVDVELANGETLQWSLRFRHGPWASGPGWLSAHGELERSDGGQVLVLDGRLGLLGQIKADSRIDWSDSLRQLSSTVQLATESGLDWASLQLDQLEWRSAGFTIQGASGQLKLTSDGAYLELAADGVSRAGGWNLREARLGVDVSFDPTEPLMDIEGDGSARELESLDETLGQPQLLWQLQRLHRPTVFSLLRNLTDPSRRDLSPELAREALTSDLLLAIPALLEHLPLVAIRQFESTVPEGMVRGSATATLSEPPPAGFLAQPGKLSPVLDLGGELELPMALADRLALRRARAELGAGADPALVQAAAEDRLARLRANQVLVSVEQHYRLDFDYAEEVLVLNGQTMRLPTF